MQKHLARAACSAFLSVGFGTRRSFFFLLGSLDSHSDRNITEDSDTFTLALSSLWWPLWTHLLFLNIKSIIFFHLSGFLDQMSDTRTPVEQWPENWFRKEFGWWMLSFDLLFVESKLTFVHALILSWAIPRMRQQEGHSSFEWQKIMKSSENENSSHLQQVVSSAANDLVSESWCDMMLK